MSSSQTSYIKEVTDSIGDGENRFLGPTYPYYKQIRSPGALYMGGSGSFPQLARNIKGLINYVEVLVTGTGPGSKTGRPLGNKFFLKTAGTCKDVSSKQIVPRYIYVNNVPEGDIPIISGAMGTNFSSFKGLVPGTMQNLNALNPMGFVAAFGAGSQPACRSLTMDTLDNNNARGRETRFVADIDIKEMDPCYWGSGGRNPLTGRRCRETFVASIDKNDDQLPQDMWIQIYFILLALGIIYFIYKILIKKGRK